MSAAPYVPQIRRYQQWLNDKHGLAFADTSPVGVVVARPVRFWQSVWDYYCMQRPRRTAGLAQLDAGARWFEARSHMRGRCSVMPARSFGGFPSIQPHQAASKASFPPVRRQVASRALHLPARLAARRRVSAYLPNVPKRLSLPAVSPRGVWSTARPTWTKRYAMLQDIGPKS